MLENLSAMFRTLENLLCGLLSVSRARVSWNLWWWMKMMNHWRIAKCKFEKIMNALPVRNYEENESNCIIIGHSANRKISPDDSSSPKVLIIARKQDLIVRISPLHFFPIVQMTFHENKSRRFMFRREKIVNYFIHYAARSFLFSCAKGSSKFRRKKVNRKRRRGGLSSIWSAFLMRGRERGFLFVCLIFCDNFCWE